MTRLISAFVVGLVFGLGLIVSSMSDPAKVKGFLDLAGDWDPSLAFVMAGAIAVALPAFAVAKRRSTSLTGAPIRLPEQSVIDAPLVGGAVLFGAGWGPVGLCPGPALADILLDWRAPAFVAAMVAGMALQGFLSQRSRPTAPEAAHTDG